VTISLFTERAYNHISLQCFSLNVIELEWCLSFIN
jgi:hypothetical protein